MNWFIYCLLTIVLYGIHDIILKHLSALANPTIASILINLSAGVSILLVFVVGYFCNTNKDIQKIETPTLVWLVIAGLCLGAATITFMKAFGSGGDFSVALPIVYIGIIILSALVGHLFFKEKISVKQLVGIAFSVVGIFLLFKK